MDERTRRVGLNEAVFRQVNEQIESLNRRFDLDNEDTMNAVCECADLGCAQQLVIRIADYERIRSDPTRFFVAPGHEQPDVEQVIEKTPGYHVVEKFSGGASRVARETDPRS